MGYWGDTIIFLNIITSNHTHTIINHWNLYQVHKSNMFLCCCKASALFLIWCLLWSCGDTPRKLLRQHRRLAFACRSAYHGHSPVLPFAKWRLWSPILQTSTKDRLSRTSAGTSTRLPLHGKHLPRRGLAPSIAYCLIFNIKIFIYLMLFVLFYFLPTVMCWYWCINFSIFIFLYIIYFFDAYLWDHEIYASKIIFSVCYMLIYFKNPKCQK